MHMLYHSEETVPALPALLKALLVSTVPALKAEPKVVSITTSKNIIGLPYKG